MLANQTWLDAKLERQRPRQTRGALYKQHVESPGRRGRNGARSYPVIGLDKFDDMTERRSPLVLRNLAPEFRGAIRTIARADHRSVTAMSKILLAEALAARGLETEAHRARELTHNHTTTT